MAEFRPGGFNILPVIIKNLLILNGLVFFAKMTLGPGIEQWMYDNLSLHDVRSIYFKPHQLITYMFMHGDFAHILGNMFAVWMFGTQLENLWGPKRFLGFYVVCGLGAALLHLGVLYVEFTPLWDQFHIMPLEFQTANIDSQRLIMNQSTSGASGSVFGILAAFGYLFPNSLIFIYFLIPMKAKWFVLLYAGAELFLGIQNSAGDNVAHWAHLGGALVGFLMVFYWNRTNRRRFY